MFMNPHMICWTLGLQTTGACKGDSGVLFYCGGKVAGAVSFGKVPCSQSGSQAVYANVAHFRQWIEQHMFN